MNALNETVQKGIENVSNSVIEKIINNFQIPTDNKYKWESNNCLLLLQPILMKIMKMNPKVTIPTKKLQTLVLYT